MSSLFVMDWSCSSPIVNTDEHEEAQDASLGKIMDRFHSQDMRSLLVKSGWHDRSGDLEDSEEEEALSLKDESPEFYTKAYQAFQQEIPLATRCSII